MMRFILALLLLVPGLAWGQISPAPKVFPGVGAPAPMRLNGPGVADTVTGGLVEDFSTDPALGSSFYSDSACTVPINRASITPIGCWKDRFGNAAIQATAASQPLFWGTSLAISSITCCTTVDGGNINVATVTTASAHNLQTGATVLIAGETPSAYNGLFQIIVTGTTTFTIIVGPAAVANDSVHGTIDLRVNAQPVVYFNGTSDYLTTGYTGEPYTISAVYRMNGYVVAPHIYTLLSAASTLGTYGSYYFTALADGNPVNSTLGGGRQYRQFARTDTTESLWGGSLSGQAWDWASYGTGPWGALMHAAGVEGPQTIQTYMFASPDGGPANWNNGNHTLTTITTPQVIGAAWENGAATNFFAGAVLGIRVWGSAQGQDTITRDFQLAEAKYGQMTAKNPAVVLYGFQGTGENQGSCGSACYDANTNLVKLGADRIEGPYLPMPVWVLNPPAHKIRNPGFADYNGHCWMTGAATFNPTNVFDLYVSPDPCVKATQFHYVSSPTIPGTTPGHVWSAHPFIDGRGLHFIHALSFGGINNVYETHPVGNNPANALQLSLPTALAGTWPSGSGGTLEEQLMYYNGAWYIIGSPQDGNNCPAISKSTTDLLSGWAVTNSGVGLGWSCGNEAHKWLPLPTQKGNQSNANFAVFIDYRGYGMGVTTTNNSSGPATNSWTAPAWLSTPYVIEGPFPLIAGRS